MVTGLLVVVMGSRVVVTGLLVVVMGSRVVVTGLLVVVMGSRVVVTGLLVVVMGSQALPVHLQHAAYHENLSLGVCVCVFMHESA